MSYAPIVKRVAPAVVTVSAAKTVENRNPLMEDPFFRRFFGPQFGGPREQMQRSLGSGVIVDPAGLVVTNNHVIDGADQVKISLADRREFEVEIVLKDPRTDLAVLRVKDGKRALPGARIRQFRRAAGRRRGAGGRQSVRRRPDRDPRHRLGGGAHPGRHLRLSVLHPDRRRDQSRQFRRRAGRHGRPHRRHQHRDLLALRRLAGRRLRHSRQHGAGGGGLGAHRRQRGEAAVARRQAAGGDAGDCRKEFDLKRPAGAVVTSVTDRARRRARGSRPATSSSRSTARRSTIPTPSTTASPPSRSAAQVELGVVRGGKESKVAVALETAPDLPRDEIVIAGALAVPRRQGRQPVAGARR